MCRNIRRLYNVTPPAETGEIRDATLQFVRKISGFHKPSVTNQASFERAICDVTAASAKLLDSLTTNAPPKQRVAAKEHKHKKVEIWKVR